MEEILIGGDMNWDLSYEWADTLRKKLSGKIIKEAKITTILGNTIIYSLVFEDSTELKLYGTKLENNHYRNYVTGVLKE